MPSSAHESRQDRAAVIANLQRVAGNQGLTLLIAKRLQATSTPPVAPGGVTVQRKGELTRLKQAVGQSEPAPKRAEKAAGKATTATLLTPKDVEKQLARLESATAKLIKSSKAGDVATEDAAFLVTKAAEHILASMANPSAQGGQGSGGATPQQVQRLEDLIANTRSMTGMTLKDSEATTIEKAAGSAGKAKIATVADLEQHVATLEEATKKLRGAPSVGDIKTHDPETQMAAFQLKKAAERISRNLPPRGSDAAKQFGPAYGDQVRKLRWVINESGLIYDEVRVEQAKMRAENVYMEAGVTAADKGGLKHLSDESSLMGAFQYHGVIRPGARADHLRAQKKRLERATALGLSEAELAAIVTFSVYDYNYINPATAHNEAWLKTNYPDLIDLAMSPSPPSLDEWSTLQDLLAAKGQSLAERQTARSGKLGSLQEEGSLHAGMLVKALLKLKPKAATVYRGERLTEKEFAEQFDEKDGEVRHRTGAYVRTTATSMSTDFETAFGFAKGGQRRIVYELNVVNGRDIKDLAAIPSEDEITVLPGSRFQIQSVETRNKVEKMLQLERSYEYIHVRGTQTT